MSESWGHGTTLGYRTVGSTGAYTNVATIIDADSKKLKRATIKTTLLASPSNTDTHRAGMVTPDPYKFKLQYEKVSHAALLAFVAADAPNHEWSIGFSDTSTYVFTGFITEFDEVPKATNEDVYENDVSLMPVGPGVFTAGA